MEYNEALDFLFSQLPMFSRVGAPAYKPGLDTTLTLDAIYGHPHRQFRAVHVAGTNGKGSTSHLIAATLQAAGYKTGLYTSPHLVDFRERMRIDGRMIPREDVVRFTENWLAVRHEHPKLKPSFFELTMMMAFDWFARQGVDIAVIEVGMGGRLDSTNIITPLLSVITNISLDHTQFLGATEPEIAREKAGIIKSGIPVVVGEAEGDVKRVFSDKAAEVGAPVTFTSTTRPLLPCPLTGDYQAKNIRTALTAIDLLRQQGLQIPQEAIIRGFAEVDKLTGLRGRWMKLSDHPLTICDTGHNEAGLGYNLAQLKRLRGERPGAKLRMVIGFVADKAIDKILSMLPGDAVYYFTNAAIPRALPVDALVERAATHGLTGTPHPNVAAAYAQAQSDSAADDILFVGGSTFIVADLLASLET